MNTNKYTYPIINGSRWKHWLLTSAFLIAHLSLSHAQNGGQSSTDPDPSSTTTSSTATTPKITIGGNVYGGGNAGNTGGQTKVLVREGDIQGNVFGGARQANVAGSAFVCIDGENISGDITINAVYGGNDIAGQIGTSTGKPDDRLDSEGHISQLDTYNAFVLTTKERNNSGKHIFIGRLFGGGNGNYNYKSENGNYTVTDRTTGDELASSTTELRIPVIAKSFIDIHGGTFGYVYGGGDSATVKEAVNICINNSSGVTTQANGLKLTYAESGSTDGITKFADLTTANLSANKHDERLLAMGINLSTYQPGYHFLRVFGGNNKAAMHIRPTWHLEAGSIINLYSGGNEGMMTSPDGLLIEIPEESEILVENVFGGCRKADVKPTDDEAGTQLVTTVPKLPDLDEQGNQKYFFPENFAARVLINGGTITNVYGGNDISGKVYFGNAIGLRTSISGSVYGGGNGAYAYTDNIELKNDLIWGDFYYDPGENSVDSLNAHRPNAEQVSLRVAGKKVLKEGGTPGAANDSIIVPTLIGEAIYVGGNCATLKGSDLLNSHTAELKIGSYVIADKVFLGNNGEKMKVASADGILAKYADYYVTTASQETKKFSSLNLTDSETFSKYMEGISLSMMPSVVFDSKKSGSPQDYVEYSSYFGSLYCGGNVGSMTIPGTTTIDFTHKIVVFDKVVGGCNEAYVPVQYIAGSNTQLNAEYIGGFIGSEAERQGNFTTDGAATSPFKNRLVLNFAGLKLQPKRWKRNADPEPSEYPQQLVWNTVDSDNNPVAPVTADDFGTNTETTTANTSKIASTDDLNRRFLGGHIYGGCYNSGIINGNVVINLDSAIVDRNILFDEVASDELGEEQSLYGNDQTKQATFTITKRHTGVILGQQGMDVLGDALNVFGGGKGKDTEIWGSTIINLNAGYTFQIFGGSQEGVIGKPVTTGGTYTFNGKQFKYDPRYSCYVNLKGTNEGVSKSADSGPQMAECEFMYGGGFFGPICGNTIVNLGKGRIFNSFAGSCNADILGHTETYIGRQVIDSYKDSLGQYADKESTYTDGFTWIRDYVYGGNDLGGEIKGEKDFTDRVRPDVLSMVHGYTTTNGADVLKANAYVEYRLGRAEGIFGGCYGTYDYTDRKFKDYTYDDGRAKEGFTKPKMNNAFVNFRPTLVTIDATLQKDTVSMVFGAGQGYSLEPARDSLQNRSYVLIDIPEGMNNYKTTQVFGAGAWGGVGMGVDPDLLVDQQDGDTTIPGDPDKATAVIDLLRGDIGAAYGASYKEGVTRRTVVNVPEGSTIHIGSIFGGAYGTETLLPCDVYEANVEYHSSDAYMVYDAVRTIKVTDPETKEVLTDPETGEEITQTIGNPLMKGNIYGGNNQERRTIYGKINIDVPVRQKHPDYGMTTATIYGAGYGPSTWSEYTEINLENGASVWEVYGGGEAGRVLNAESVQKYMNMYATSKPEGISKPDVISDTDFNNKWNDIWKKAWTLGGGLDPESFTITANGTSYIENDKTNLSNPLARTAEVDDRNPYDAEDYPKGPKQANKYNTNVIIHKGAYVGNYAYGGGLGKDGLDGSGDVYGSTYIALLGGQVNKDIYAAGTLGAIYDLFGANNFTASATAYIWGGTCRNVYGGGWKGDVGYTSSETFEDVTQGKEHIERPGETHVVIGIRPDQTGLVNELKKVVGNTATTSDYGFHNGKPAIQRNAYSGGEGGAVFGSAYLTLNNGYIGYGYSTDSIEAKAKYELPDDYYYPMIEDKTYKVNNVFVPNIRLRDCGNMFGGGYDVRSSVDTTYVTLWNGIVRNSVHGGGEIATIGRGAVTASGEMNSIRTLNAIYKGGKTTVEMYNGHVMRNVFGGGKGYNIYGYGQEGTRYTDGYVFGQTEVHIHGGEVGTAEGISDGYGNVFGGGDIGYVYSPNINSNKTKEKIGTGSPGHIYYYNTDNNLEEDCKVVVSPYLQIKGANTILYNGKTYRQYDYVPTDYLNTLPGKKEDGSYTGTDWENLYTGASVGAENPTDDDTTERGIFIHNAVFGGGNVSSNSDDTYAGTTTVYGNATATLYDVYHRDFITIGTEHTGGLYGGGNLSVVDGYRELNITNYGTDYYGLKQTISIDEYRGLSNRERAYFKLEYQCIAKNDVEGETSQGVKINGIFYENNQRLSEEEYLKLANSDNEEIANLAKNSFMPYGFCSIYAGRLLNTIQRADFCGVYGSRMVLQGARDRVAEVGEAIDYTINRVGELSLNEQHTVRDDDTEPEDASHGNYFGIYSLVNYLGNLTSDRSFGNTYVNGAGKEVNGETYYSHKSTNHGKKERNIGQSPNQVALASGVFLELTTENSTPDHKDYGYVTGVIELDLINVKKDLVGGGFVYAKNEHRVPMYYPNKTNVILSEYNHQKTKDGSATGALLRDEARTYKRYRYATPATETAAGLTTYDPQWADENWTESTGAYVISGAAGHEYETMAWQTSGNFIHPEKHIVDDCYPTNNAFILGSTNYSEAHYWYVKGEVYIYDQKVSAYTGSANAYSKEVHLPLTITAASHGQLQLINVKPNLYAYYTDNNGTRVKLGTLGDDNKPIDKVTVNNESDTYQLNDVISWWDWHQMSAGDRQYFVPQTYVNCVPCTIDGTLYDAGTYVMDENDFNAFKSKVASGTVKIYDSNGGTFLDDEGNDIGLEHVFRSSNNISHETGYVLTFDMNTPTVWDDYYTAVDDNTKRISKAEYDELLANANTESERLDIINAWREGPTFTPTTSGVYGTREYKAGEIITEAAYQNAGTGKDKMERAYVATATVTYVYEGVSRTMNPGAAISSTEYQAIDATAQASFDEALFCTTTVKLGKDNYMLYGELKTEQQIQVIKAAIDADTDRSNADKEKLKAEVDAALSNAYILTADGIYGGQQFNTGTNYGAIEAWCSLSPADRENFTYNYDGLDLLVSTPYLNDRVLETTSPDISSTVATFRAPYTDKVPVEYQAVYNDDASKTIHFNDGTTETFTKGTDEATIPNTKYEAIRNDKANYIHITTHENEEVVHISTSDFVYLGVPYGVGQVIDEEDVWKNNSQYIQSITFATPGERYYCYNQYTKIGGTEVNVGAEITPEEFRDENNVPNDQQYFIIQGKEPTEKTTLYVSRESNAYDVMKEKIITVVYQYTYNEDDDDSSVKKTNELHVINIHLQLESGAPIIGHLQDPPIVLPSNAVGLNKPDVNPGLYEILNSGWELFATPDDATNHRNGVPFENNGTPLYWYQNQKNWVAFYSRTYLGKTYSNSVPLSVANYHDLDAVMKDKDHHLYIDRDDVDRDCKIYIDDRKCQSDANRNEIDLLKDLFDLSLQTAKADDGATAGHNTLNSHVKGLANLEFFLRSDMSPKAYASGDTKPGWTSIGNSSQCFEGVLHGDGHTISGLSQSLFGSLCGQVYNLGVTGSFTGAGIAETGDGYIENSWVKTTATPTTGEGHYAVFGNPTRTGTEGLVQVVNCYYPQSNAYTVPSSAAHGKATAMPDAAFYNGTVAYNLNGFYLNKRYYDNQVPTGSGVIEYQYLPSAADGTLPATMQKAKYPADYAFYQPDIKVSDGETLPSLGYVEWRFYDGDFRYAGGSIPEGLNARTRSVTTTKGTGDDAVEVTTDYFTPIWPDDYLFFGQTLSYGYNANRTHEALPSAIIKTGDRLPSDYTNNRVYRAPAYFSNSNMGVVHFNPDAVFAQTKKDDATVAAYKNLTAVDFSGYQDAAYQRGTVTAAPYANVSGGAFFPPLLDDGGLSSLYLANDITRNILIYTKYDANEGSAARKTDDVVSNYLPDQSYVETNSDYHTVADWDSYADNVKGHRVQHINGNYVALNDHLLVDRQDFNCPIPYTFANSYRMWYQREPDCFVDRTKGWEVVSLPFTAEIVTTTDKGEITHFFSGSTKGHEYWLREFNGDVEQQKDANNQAVEGVYTAKFEYPTATDNDAAKTVGNTFLWDYYYEAAAGHNLKDQNADEYQRYYADTRSYVHYPRLTAGTPYLIGFPGKTYYEFDLSGNFSPDNTAGWNITKNLGVQTITFASKTGATINISDTETQDVSDDGYTFKPTYMNTVVPADNFVITNDGSCFNKVTADVAVAAFRPYLLKTSPSRQQARSIVFLFGNNEDDDPGMPHDSGPGTITVNAGKHKIIVSSTLDRTADVRILSPSGIAVAMFTIEPGATVETRIVNAGVYLVQTTDGRHAKKLAVK